MSLPTLSLNQDHHSETVLLLKIHSLLSFMLLHSILYQISLTRYICEKIPKVSFIFCDKHFQRSQKFTDIHWCSPFSCFRLPNNVPSSKANLFAIWSLKFHLCTMGCLCVVGNNWHRHWQLIKVTVFIKETPVPSLTEAHGAGGGDAQDWTVSSGHDRTTGLMNPQLRLPAQTLYKIKPVHIPAWRGRLLSFHPQLWATDSCSWRRKITFP